MPRMTHTRIGSTARTSCRLTILAIGLSIVSAAHAGTLSPSLLPQVEAATFEVVAAKPAHDPLTYAEPLPLDLLPDQQRNDKYNSIGTAFAIGPNRYVTAAHVLLTSRNSLWGPLLLRDDQGHVYAIDKVQKFVLRRDFAVFSLVHPPAKSAVLPTDTHPVLNQAVYSVGNAWGSGVTIRAGLYTSNTPEQQDGAWKWMRFSAAASPGDSGGPLLDQNGHAIGLVLASSPNENLNYALPISEILDAPPHLAVFNRRIPYGFGLIDSTLTATFQGQFALPKSVAGFDAAFLKLDHDWEDRELTALMAQQAARMFPEGPGSDRLLHDVAAMRTMPWLYTRDSAGTWHATLARVARIPLDDNGYLALGRAAGSVLFHLRLPDSVSVTTLVGHPESVMDWMLKAGFVRRDVASDKVKIASFGKPASDQKYTDRWQRQWRVAIWSIPFNNHVQIMLALPVPDGYVGMLRSVTAFDQHVNLIHLEAMTGFFDVAYGGTLVQWNHYLGKPDLLPTMMQRIQISADYGKDFRYSSPRISFSFTPALQKIAPNSELTLGCNYSRNQGKVVWGVSDIRVAAQRGTRDWINIEREVKPSSDLGDAYEIPWNKIAHQQFPFNGEMHNNNGVTKITAVVASPVKQPTVRYTAFYAKEGTNSQATMKSGLDSLMKGINVTEPGYRMAAANP